MGTEPTTFRPRNGVSAEAYWRIRYWCEKNGFSFSDVLNALMMPIAYYLENHCEIDKIKSMASVIMNFGTVDILHVNNGKCYPLASSLPSNKKDPVTLEIMQERIQHWKERNAEFPTEYDLMLATTHAKEKLKTKRR